MIPTWEDLFKIRRLNVHSIAKWAAFIIPVFASIDLLTNKHLNIHISMPVNLLLMYLSSITFLLSSLIVDSFCPLFIKDNKDFANFLDALLQKSAKIYDIKQKATSRKEALLEQISDEIEKATGSSSPDDNIKKLFLMLLSEDVPAEVLNMAQPTWEDANNKWWLFRAIAITGFAVSASIGIYITFYDAPRRVVTVLAQLEPESVSLFQSLFVKHP